MAEVCGRGTFAKHALAVGATIMPPALNPFTLLQKVAGFGSISLVSIRPSGGASWIAMDNTFGSAWEVSNAPSLPWDFQFTSGSGQSVRLCFSFLLRIEEHLLPVPAAEGLSMLCAARGCRPHRSEWASG